MARILRRGGLTERRHHRACSPARSARPRLLRLFERYGIRTTWFIPGHSIETFPEQMDAVAAAGHEIGAHGYSAREPDRHDPEQEQDDPRQVASS